MKAASTNENTFLKVLNLPQGGIAVFDKGFNKYRCLDEWTQHNRFLMQMSVGSIPHQKLLRSIELFATEVVPAVNKALQSK